jgi:endoglucanase
LEIAGAAALLASGCSLLSEHASRPRAELPAAFAGRLPRWRGFNLFEKYNARNDPFKESDLAWMVEWGFNFVRIPLDYRLWTDPSDWTKLREPVLREIDDVVDLGYKHRIHVQLNFHRAPGYSVARPPELRSVWTDEEALQVCALHWRAFARRYRGRPNHQVSFNLFNEPAHVDGETHRRVVERVVEAIWEEDETRLVVCDGRDYGRTAPEELLGLGVAAATRGYEPFGLTHYQAGWIDGAHQWPAPAHPMVDDQGPWDSARLRERWVAPWVSLEQRGMGVMVGEFGAYHKTPHHVVLAWMEDMLRLWHAAGWGWALWNFRGRFGILDSARADVAYDDWRGHKLDRAMLALLQRF